MAALKHDAQGFLVGDPIDIGRALAVWDDIRSDVRAIRKAVMGASEAAVKGGGKHADASRVITPRGGMEEADPAVKATPRGRERAASAIPARRYSDEIPSLLRKAVTPVRGQGNEVASTSAKPGASGVMVRPERKSPQSVAKPAGRDGRGRFTKGDGRPDGLLPNDAADDADTGALRSIADRIVGAVADSSGGMEEADPAVKAFNEVAQPMARGYEMLTGGSEDKKQTGFLRRIFSTLSVFRKEETAYSKAANKSLKLLEEKPEAKGSGDGGGLLGMMSGLLSKIPVIGPMLAGGAGMLGGASKGLMGAGKGLLGAGKGMLRRIPLLGALIGGVGAASDIYSSETDDSLTRRQKDEKAGKAVGGFAGSVGGMLAGAKLGAMAGAIGGPIGVAIGGVLGGAVGMFFGDQAGQIIGDTVGGWANDLRNADIVGTITGAWDGVVAGFKSAYETIGKTWGGFVDSAKAGWDTIANLFTSAYEGLKSIPVIGPAIQAVEDAAKKTAEAASAAAAAVKTKAVEVGTKAVEKVQQGAEYVANNTTVGKGIKATGEAVKYGTDVAVDVAKSAKARITGKASENKAALVSQMAASGITDPKEQAMFMAQMDHESGGFTKMEERFNYRSADRLMAVSGSARKLGKPAVEAAMAQGPEAVAEAMYGGRMGNVNPGDAYAFRGRGHVQLTGRDNYTAAGKALGLDLANNPDLAAEPENAAKIAAWYWKKNKLGDAAKRGDVLAVTKKINGGTNGLDDRESKYAKYLASANDGSLAQATGGASGSPATPGVVASQQAPSSAIASPAPPVVASISAPPVSVAPTAPPIAEAPTVAVPMASADTKKAAAVAAPSQDAGQDLKDRRIAHIVTGGLSNA